METKAEAPATKKTTVTKKQTTKKSAPSPITVGTPTNDEFDAIFGGSTAKKPTAPTKSEDSAKYTPKAKADKISAAQNDEFDAIFGKGK